MLNNAIKLGILRKVLESPLRPAGRKTVVTFEGLVI